MDQNEFGLDKGYILTKEELEETSIDGREIHLLPVWYWLLAPFQGG